jgi:hypothetical protein
MENVEKKEIKEQSESLNETDIKNNETIEEKKTWSREDADKLFAPDDETKARFAWYKEQRNILMSKNKNFFPLF